MANEQYRWLNRETAERLLRGEPLEAVDASARDEAERLAKAIGALSADAASAQTELPGEEAALAAFRKAREGEVTAVEQAGHRVPSARPADAGLVGMGGRTRAARRPGWARPVRLALTAALAAGMIGGVAVAAGSGVLPTPFGGDTPGPAASVSAAVTPERPLVSPSQGGTSGLLPPSGGASGTPGDGSSPGTDREDPAKGGATGSAETSHSTGTWWSGAPSACRDIRAGKELAPDRKHALDGAAGGSARVWKYCQGILETSGNASGDKDKDKDGQGDQNGQGGQKGDSGQGGDDDGHIGPGGNDHHGDGAIATPSPSAFVPLAPKRPATTVPLPSPSPTYTAL
ncbi:hypothetical protein [Streptomyces sp. NPDC051636]|uniref:hypothetical protein n=1 Tax=Streptomyces sp. NPDC051636 TaxID=3365663 RepID=UPI0037905503